MPAVDIYIRFADENISLAKAATLQMDGNLVYKDEGGECRAHAITLLKFATLTLVSPLVCLARLVRSVAFTSTGDFNRARSEFVGGLAIPLLASYCLLGTLSSAAVSLITGGKVSFYSSMRKTYAHFEAWTNGISLQAIHLASYSQRVSDPTNFIKNSWTTAPCMQPILERGIASRGGLLDVERMRKIFPLAKINGIHTEHGKIVIQSEYVYENVHKEYCLGACERAKIRSTICCCFHVEATYDRVLCCDMGVGNCSTIFHPSNSTGMCFCTVCGIGVCCCTEKVDNVHMGITSTGCLMPC